MGLGDYYGMVVQNGEGPRSSSPTPPTPTPHSLDILSKVCLLSQMAQGST